MEKYKLRRIGRDLAYKGKILTMYRDEMVLPDGKKEYWDFVAHPTGGACVVPVLPDGRILVEHQYRPAVDAETIELPAGARNSAEEDSALTAKRELEEETGYTCDALRLLVRLQSAPSWCNEHTDVYLAEEIRPIGERNLDEAEEIGLEAIPLHELLQKIYAGKIRDAKTVAGILAYANRKSGF